MLFTILQYVMSVKLRQKRFWPCRENGGWSLISLILQEREPTWNSTWKLKTNLVARPKPWLSWLYIQHWLESPVLQFPWNLFFWWTYLWIGNSLIGPTLSLPWVACTFPQFTCLKMMWPASCRLLLDFLFKIFFCFKGEMRATTTTEKKMEFFHIVQPGPGPRHDFLATAYFEWFVRVVCKEFYSPSGL